MWFLFYPKYDDFEILKIYIFARYLPSNLVKNYEFLSIKIEILLVFFIFVHSIFFSENKISQCFYNKKYFFQK